MGKTKDPYIIMKAKELIGLIARSVPVHEAVKILHDDISSEIFLLNDLSRDSKKIATMKNRLIGPNGATIRALELLTNCYILVQGSSISVLGHHNGIKIANRIINDCFGNVHPLHHIKLLIITKEMAKKITLVGDNRRPQLPRPVH